ncbi:uncharacterized protein LOC143062266 [Mytilus galloprovincialis]|uniref:uncharacterized protein LOC143062266 n=1 Tax=Mytilus galloprovincialis TaxID=29158 RepID=UPI003F7C8C89
MCSWPCNWQERTFYNDAAEVDLLVPNAYQLKIAPDTVIECLIREGPFIVSRRGANKDVYRCIKVNDVCDDSFVVIETNLYQLDSPPNLCDICSPAKLTSKPQVWVAKEKTLLECNVPKNCPLGEGDSTAKKCNGCEKNQPNNDICCSSCEESNYGDEDKSTYGSYPVEEDKSTYDLFTRSYYKR